MTYPINPSRAAAVSPAVDSAGKPAEPTTPDASHPNWCDRILCTSKKVGAEGNHRSAAIKVEVDPLDWVGVEISLWRHEREGRTKVLFEFPGGSGEGNELTLEQSAQLAVGLAALLRRSREV